MSAEANARTARRLLIPLAIMVALVVSAVPLYNLFCRVTGYGGTTQVAATESDVILDQVITIRFDANTAAGMAWEFRPVEPSMEIRIGETGLAFYEAYNPTDHPIAGTASFNVAPFTAGLYFSKIDCFCFEEQVLQPGERVMMPVSFFVDPEMLEDPQAASVPAITLSYTFHRMELPESSETALLAE